MDANTNSNAGYSAERSAEEIAWDKEFTDSTSASNAASVLGDLVKLTVQIPAAVIQMPFNMLPPDTARHARAAAREGFLAIRSLLSAIGDGIEDLLAEPGDRATPTAGPQGTWGNTRSPSTLASNTSSARVKKIDITDSGDSPSPNASGQEEGRGMRADIQY